MRKACENMEHARVGHFESILESAGTRTRVQNLGASVATGGVAATHVFPELWVVEGSDCEQAIGRRQVSESRPRD